MKIKNSPPRNGALSLTMAGLLLLGAVLTAIAGCGDTEQKRTSAAPPATSTAYNNAAAGGAAVPTNPTALDPRRMAPGQYRSTVPAATSVTTAPPTDPTAPDPRRVSTGQ